mgnify:CR=1 FL=1
MAKVTTIGAASSQPDREEMLARAAAMTPRLLERAEHVENTRMIHPDTVQDFWDTQLWSILKPKRYGGLELDFGTVMTNIGMLKLPVQNVSEYGSNLASTHVE